MQRIGGIWGFCGMLLWGIPTAPGSYSYGHSQIWAGKLSFSCWWCFPAQQCVSSGLLFLFPSQNESPKSSFLEGKLNPTLWFHAARCCSSKGEPKAVGNSPPKPHELLMLWMEEDGGKAPKSLRGMWKWPWPHSRGGQKPMGK